jgi:hypothetical protein
LTGLRAPLQPELCGCSTRAVLVIELPDGQVRRISASRRDPEPVRHGGPAGLVDRVVGQVLGPDEASVARILSREDWLGMVPDSALSGDVCLAAAWTKPGRPSVATAVGRDGVPGEEEM